MCCAKQWPAVNSQYISCSLIGFLGLHVAAPISKQTNTTHRNTPGSLCFMIYLLHFWLQVQLCILHPPVLLWWFCYSRSEENHLQLNVSEIKVLVVDFRQTEKLLTHAIIQCEELEILQTYNYLCVYRQAGRPEHMPLKETEMFSRF